MSRLFVYQHDKKLNDSAEKSPPVGLEAPFDVSADLFITTKVWVSANTLESH